LLVQNPRKKGQLYGKCGYQKPHPASSYAGGIKKCNYFVALRIVWRFFCRAAKVLRWIQLTFGWELRPSLIANLHDLVEKAIHGRREVLVIGDFDR
jgi:hypothetical protein